MDNKALKTGVYYNENIFSEICEQPIDVDFTLPDYCPDISKIFKCKAVTRIISKGINGKNVTVDGNVLITLLYCDNCNNLCSYEYLYPFSKIKEMPDECDSANLTVSSKCEYINCRAVTGRKVDIHGAVSLNIRVFKRCSNQIVTDYDDNNVELKRMIAPATVPVVYHEKYLAIEEEISIGNTQPPILKVLRTQASPVISECKIMNDKAVAKGEMALTVLYCAEGFKAPQILKTRLPFSQIVEMPGITEICKCDIKPEIATLEVKPFAVMGGECRNFSVNAKLLLKCESYCVNEIAVIEDAFSTKYETELIKKSLTFNCICDTVSENCHIKKNVELSENIASVVDVWCEVQSKKVRFEKDKICLNATILVSMLACDGEDNVFFYEKVVDFEWSHTTSCNSENLSFDPEIEITSTGFTILNANCIELRAELTLSGAVCEKNEVMLITDMQIFTDKPCKCNKKGGMVVCFNLNQESLWNIARKYNASIEELMAINELENENISGKKMLLVPIN